MNEQGRLLQSVSKAICLILRKLVKLLADTLATWNPNQEVSHPSEIRQSSSWLPRAPKSSRVAREYRSPARNSSDARLLVLKLGGEPSIPLLGRLYDIVP
jgi:hypothetical protein